MLDIDKKEVHKHTNTPIHTHFHTCTGARRHIYITLWRYGIWYKCWERQPEKSLENIWGRRTALPKSQDFRVTGSKVEKNKVPRQKQALHVGELPSEAGCLKHSKPGEDPKEITTLW